MLLTGLYGKQKSLKYVIDVTIGYMEGKPIDLLKNVVAGDNEPCQTVIHYRKYPAATVPRSESTLTHWIYERYAEKDRLLDHYYRTGNFPGKWSNGSIMADDVACRSLLRPISFSPTVCVLIHAFYVLSTVVHVYLAMRIGCLVWSCFGYVLLALCGIIH